MHIAFSILSVYVLPLPLFLLMAFLWWRLAPDLSFLSFVLGVPVLYGYIVPGIATNWLRKWRFKGRFLLGRYYVHHGFLYGSKMAFLLYGLFVLLPQGESLTGAKSAAVVVMNGLMCAVVFWFGDIQLVKAGLVEIDNRPARQGRSPEEIVTVYAPVCFFLIGAAYAAGVVLAYDTFVVARNTDAAACVRVWALGGLPLFTVPSLAYHWTSRAD
jgi:hypothetical protein